MVELHDFALIAVILSIAALAGLVATKLRQPMIVAFIGVGIVVGPTGTGWVVTNDTIELLARLGIAILLFLVGLRLDMNLIRTTGPVALITGIGQVVATSVLGFLLAIGFGTSAVAALYIGLAVTFSSTIIIVKLLSDTREIEQLHGRIAVGILIVQDLVVVIVMIAINAFGQETDDSMVVAVALVFVKGIALLAGIGILMRFVLPWLLHHVARSQELLVLFAVAYAIAAAAVTESLGFSSEVGAFLAGVSLATTPYRDALGARLVSLRDFLLLFFFLDLGAGLDFADASGHIIEVVAFSLFVLIAKPLIIMLLMTVQRYPPQVSFMTGLPLGQISEFSLILAAIGVGLGHITNTTSSLITMVALITIGGSAYLIPFSHRLYQRLERFLRVLDRTSARSRELTESERDVDAILYGLGRFGRHIADQCSSGGRRILAVDFDPHRLASNARPGITAVYGSATDIHFLESLPLSRATFIISTIPTMDANLTLLHALKHHHYEGHIVMTAHHPHDAERLRAAGADTVLEPFSLAAEATTEVLDRLIGDDHDHGPGR